MTLHIDANIVLYYLFFADTLPSVFLLLLIVHLLIFLKKEQISYKKPGVDQMTCEASAFPLRETEPHKENKSPSQGQVLHKYPAEPLNRKRQHPEKRNTRVELSAVVKSLSCLLVSGNTISPPANTLNSCFNVLFLSEPGR